MDKALNLCGGEGEKGFGREVEPMTAAVQPNSIGAKSSCGLGEDERAYDIAVAPAAIGRPLGYASPGTEWTCSAKW